MEYIEALIAPLLDMFEGDRQVVLLALLLALGGLAQLLFGMAVRRLHRLAGYSAYHWDDIFVTALEVPLRWVLWLSVGYLALEIYPLTAGLHDRVSRAADTVLILLLAWFAHRLIALVEAELLLPEHGSGSSTDRATVRATAKLARITLWILAALMVLQSIGVSIEGLLAFGGIGGIAVGFAAKDLLANFFGGLSIYLDRPFTLGDWIRSPDREIEGTVESIGWRLTVIRTFDQRPLYVPNSVFSQIAVENPSRMYNRRIYETIGLRYADAGAMAAIVEQVREMLQAHEAIDQGRTTMVNFVAFGASSLDFFVYAFTRTTVWVEYHQIKEEILLRILDIIHRNGAEVAFPTRTLHIEPVAPEPQE